MNTDFTASFAKDLRNLRDQRILKHVQRVIHAIENAETLADLKHLKKLQGTVNCYRIRAGDYRLGFIVEDNVVRLVRCLHGKEMYRYFP